MWADYTLGEHIGIQQGFPFSSVHFNARSDGLPLIRIRDIHGEATEVHYDGPFSQEYVVNPGDILIGMDGEFTACRWRGPPGLLNQRVMKLFAKPGSELDLDYVFHWLGPYLKQVENATSATTVKHLSIKDVARAIIHAPMKNAQVEIGRVLSATENSVLLIERYIAKQERIRAGLLQDLFTRGVDQNGALRPPREEAPGLYHQTELGWLPKGWKTALVREIADVVRGSTPRPAKDPRYFDGDFTPWITVGELSRDEWPYLESTAAKLTELGASFSRELAAGTLIISNSGYGCGVPKILNLTGCANDGIAALLNLSKEFNALFLYYYFFHNIETLRTKVARGNDQPNLNTDMIGAFRVPKPSDDEQAMIVECLWHLQVATRSEQTALSKLRLQRSALMQDLLTGRVSVAPLLQAQAA